MASNRRWRWLFRCRGSRREPTAVQLFSLGGFAPMNSEDRDKQRRKELMLRGVDDQLNSGDTPEVRVHYERLLSLGHSDSEARELMATVLAFYIWHTARHDDYTYSDYVAELEKLPEIDWKDDDKDDA
jgi:hypothetical protein